MDQEENFKRESKLRDYYKQRLIKKMEEKKERAEKLREHKERLVLSNRDAKLNVSSIF
jgi:hypothetical protein